MTKETIRSEMDELKNLVGQLSHERAVVDSEVEELAARLEESEETSGLSSALSAAVASDPGVRGSASLTAQIRSLHVDLKQARSDRDHAQEAKELAILEQAEMAEELEGLRSLAGTAQVQLSDLESKVREVSTEKDQLESEKNRLAAERETLANDKDSLSAEVAAAQSRLAESEEKLASATANLDTLTTELEDVQSNAGASVQELQAAVAARVAMESHVDALGGAQAKARAELERVNDALDDKNASDAQRIETLKIALASVTAERNALQAKLEAVRATVSTLQGEMATLDSNFSDAESVASVLSERMEELQSSVDSLPTETGVSVNLSEFETPEMPEPEVAGEAFDTAVDSDVVESDVVESDVVDSDVVDSDVVDEAAAAADVSDDDADHTASADDSIDTNPTDAVLDEAEPVVESNELIPEEILTATTVDAAEYRDPEMMDPRSEPETSPLVMSDTAEDFSADILDEGDPSPTESKTENIDEVHALVAETVASFEPSETDDLPGSTVSATDAAEAGASSVRGGLTSLFSSFVPGRSNRSSGDAQEAQNGSVSESDGGADTGLLAAAGVAPAESAVSELLGNGDIDTSPEPAIAESEPDDAASVSGQAVATNDLAVPDTPSEPASVGRSPIVVPSEAASDPLETARYVVHAENAVLLIDGDPVAAMGWPSVDRVEQRRNLVHYLSVMAGSTGAAPDVLLDRDFGIDRLPDSRSVRVRVTEEGGLVSAKVVSLIDSYPNEWPVVVVTDNMDLAAEAAMKGATLLENGQLLDLFIAP